MNSEQPWQSLRVIVTAAGSGIGREVAEAFAGAGARVHICDVDAAQIREGYLRQTSMRTFINGRDIANTILFLCSPAGDKISGQVTSIDGFTETLRNL